jgi:hypothetical protein
MLPDAIRYAGLTLDPAAILKPRCHRGVVPTL